MPNIECGRHPSIPRAVTLLARIIGWSLAVAIAVLSLMPSTARPSAFGLPGLLQHLAAYSVTGFFLTVGTCSHHWRLGIVAFLFAFAAAMEVGQMFVPGRTPGFLDILAGGLGGAAGCVLTMLLKHRGRSCRR